MAPTEFTDPEFIAHVHKVKRAIVVLENYVAMDCMQQNLQIVQTTLW